MPRTRTETRKRTELLQIHKDSNPQSGSNDFDTQAEKTQEASRLQTPQLTEAPED